MTNYLNIGYVYTLSFEGNIFYIGSTGCPLQRLQEHLCCQDLCTGRMMHWIRYCGKTPDIKLVFHSEDNREVIKHEYSLIKELVSIRHPLCNVDGNTVYNTINMPSVKNMPRPKFNPLWRKTFGQYLRDYQKEARLYYENKSK